MTRLLLALLVTILCSFSADAREPKFLYCPSRQDKPIIVDLDKKTVTLDEGTFSIWIGEDAIRWNTNWNGIPLPMEINTHTLTLTVGIEGYGGEPYKCRFVDKSFYDNKFNR